MRFIKKKRKFFVILSILFTYILVDQLFNIQNIFNKCLYKFCKERHDINYGFLDNFVDISEREIDFQKDMLALLHIQKTSGMFWEQSIHNNLMIYRNDKWEKGCSNILNTKRAICFRNRHMKSFFWDRYMSKFCDIHADYTELKNCIMLEYNNRIKIPIYNPPFYGIIHFITMLRDPVQRYISEFHHVKRGATWEKSVRVCNEELLYLQKCSSNGNWKDATWNRYLTCENNLANNRQTRMLANYNQLGCRILKCWTKAGNCTAEEKQLHDKKILESAKQTLLSISFFGLAEYQSLSQYLFEKTFKGKMKFSKPLIESKTIDYESSNEYKNLTQIKHNNYLDIQLYEFANQLFFKRIKYFQEKDAVSSK